MQTVLLSSKAMGSYFSNTSPTLASVTPSRIPNPARAFGLD